MREAAALFAKAPRPGRVKTRLTAGGVWTPEQAATLHRAAVEDFYRRLLGAFPDVFLFSDEPCPEWEALAGEVRLQRPGDLGARMEGCFEDLAADGFERAVIVGADSPTLPMKRVREALDALVDERDAVVAPTEDGGYCLVGVRRPWRGMFDGVRWSRPTTLAETEAAFARAGRRIVRLEGWWDVDDPADVERLRAEAGLGPRLRQWFAANPPGKPSGY